MYGVQVFFGVLAVMVLFLAYVNRPERRRRHGDGGGLVDFGDDCGGGGACDG